MMMPTERYSSVVVDRPSEKDDTGPTINADYVLCYVKNNNLNHVEIRGEFEKRLKNYGLELEYGEIGQLCFVKIHATKEVLRKYCAIMKLKMPMKQLLANDVLDEMTNDPFDDAQSWFANFFSFVQLDWAKFPKREYRLTPKFSTDMHYLFDIDSEDFFTTNVRIMIVDFILNLPFSRIQRPMDNGVYMAAYPLHDATYKQRGGKRALLYDEWASMSKCLKLQPLDTIQEYFGANVALYFAWLGFYTYMLIPPSIAGIICITYGWITLGSNTLVQDTCSPWAESVIMCPQCDRTCDYSRLNETCFMSRITHLFDNSATPIFAIFMSFWSALYLELWRRRSAELTHHWGLEDRDLTSEDPRPRNLGLLAKIKKIFKITEIFNATTQETEPRVSFWKWRVPATCLSFSIVFFFAMVATVAVFAVVLYRISIATLNELFDREPDSTTYKTFALPSIAAVMSLVCSFMLTFVYDRVAVYLTELEMLRTQTEFDDSLTLKIYLLRFVNYYASIFYIAFLKGNFIGFPKEYNRILGFRQEECSRGGCLMELCIQLAIRTVGKQAFYTAKGMILPMIYKLRARFRMHISLEQNDPTGPCSPFIRDFKLLDFSPRMLQVEYLEMVMQFGFVTLFVVAFPLAPLFALVNNVLEMRLDATKFLRYYRRPVPKRVKDIGIWKQILDTLARISVLTNAFIIAFSSNMIPRLVYMTTVSPDRSDTSFLNNSLAYFNTADFRNDTEPLTTVFPNITLCRYVQYRNPPDHPELPYKRSTLYWYILAARLAFVVVFQNIVGLVTMATQWCLSGVPRKLSDRVIRENDLIDDIIMNRENVRALEDPTIQRPIPRPELSLLRERIRPWTRYSDS